MSFYAWAVWVDRFAVKRLLTCILSFSLINVVVKHWEIIDAAAMTQQEVSSHGEIIAQTSM